MFWLSYECFSILYDAFLLKSVISSHNSCERKTFGTGLKGKIFGSLHSMYMGLKILLLISGHILFMINKEWSLSERVAKSLFDQFGKSEIDLFASCLNTKYVLPKYASYHTNLTLCVG